jgi:iron complex transport system substrate-binding protein
MALSRRSLLFGTAGVAAGGFLAACGDSGTADAPATSSSGGTGGTFPASVTHQFGTTTVDAAPKTVVSLGWGDADALLALGVVPAGILDWFKAWPVGVGPWAQDKLGGAKPTILTGPEINFESVATLRPDLITFTKSDNVQATWDKLDKLAPTLSGPAGAAPYLTPLKDQTVMIAQALGRKADGETLVSGADKALADAKAANPSFAGKTVVVGAYFNGQYGAYLKGDGRVDFMEALGFTNSPKVEALKKNNFYVDISAEQVALLDADLTVMFGIGAAEDLKNDKVLNSIASAKAGHLVIVSDSDLVNAFSTNSVLSIPYTIEKFVPQVKTALGA